MVVSACYVVSNNVVIFIIHRFDNGIVESKDTTSSDHFRRLEHVFSGVWLVNSMASKRSDIGCESHGGTLRASASVVY